MKDCLLTGPASEFFRGRMVCRAAGGQPHGHGGLGFAGSGLRLLLALGSRHSCLGGLGPTCVFSRRCKPPQDDDDDDDDDDGDDDNDDDDADADNDGDDEW